MRWFSHRRSHASEDHSRKNGTWGPHPRGRLQNKLPHFFVFFCAWWPWPLTFDPQIRTWSRFLYIAPNHQVSSSYVYVRKLTYWQTNRRHWKHPPRSAVLHQFVNSANGICAACQLVVCSCSTLWTNECVFASVRFATPHSAPCVTDGDLLWPALYIWDRTMVWMTSGWVHVAFWWFYDVRNRLDRLVAP